MKHTKNDCRAHDLIIAEYCGLFCSNCFQCKCGICCNPDFIKERDAIEKEHNALSHQYSYPTFQIQELRKKYSK